MYRLENDVQWTPELKEAFKHNVTRAKVLWSGTTLTEDNYIKSVTIDEQRYIQNYGFIGTATAKMLELKLIDNNRTINLENQELTIKIGADYDGYTYYINYGNFIVDKPPEHDETNGETRIVAYDYMIKFNKPYEDRVTYPCTLYALLQDICSQAGVVLGSSSFANMNFTVADNQFEGATLREVLQNIAKCAFSWARIGQDNKLYLDFDVISSNTETITIDEYKLNSFKKANEYYGPVNQVTYADSYIQGQEARVKDQASININGLKELVVYDNLFAYTPTTRNELIQEGIRLFGLEYMPIMQLDLIGFAYLDCNDKIEAETLSEDTFVSRVFNHKIEYNGTLHDGIITEGTSNNEEIYRNTANNITQDQQTRFVIDKANKKMEWVIENVDRQDTKISQITQTVDDINSKISDIADITTYGESSYATVDLDDINESEPIMLKVHPTIKNISYLYPHTNLYPSSTLYMPTRTVRFIRTYEEEGETKTENIDYILPDDLLIYDDTTYDEFYLDYESQTCQVTKRCKYNADGTVGVLDAEIVRNYDEYPSILLGEGNYTIQLLGYEYGYLFVRLMTKNIYTTQFYTKAETNSLIDQTSSSIDLSVNQKLSNYSTTTEMQSAINLSSNSIMSVVSTKVGNDEIISKINQTPEAIKIDASKIDINGTISANGNFKINLDGTMDCKGARIHDGVISLTDNGYDGGTSYFEIERRGTNYPLSGMGLYSDFALFATYEPTQSGGYTDTSMAIISAQRESARLSIDTKLYWVEIKASSTNDTETKMAELYMHKTFNDTVYNRLRVEDTTNSFFITRGNHSIYSYVDDTNDTSNVFIQLTDGTNTTTIFPKQIITPTVIQTSRAEEKKNFEKYENALDKLKDIDIYKYNFKFENDKDKKHIGFVIGKNFKYLDELTNANNTGADTYSLGSFTLQVCKELYELIKEVQVDVKKLGGK